MKEKENEMKNFPSAKNSLPDYHNLPNPVLVSRQIEDLRRVLRRMKAYQPETLDPITASKLEYLKDQN